MTYGDIHKAFGPDHFKVCSILNAEYRDEILEMDGQRYCIDFFHTTSKGEVCAKVYKLCNSVILTPNMLLTFKRELK